MMNRIFYCLCFLMLFLFFTNSNSMAMSIIDPKDNILDVEENNIYLLGCSYDYVVSPLKQISNCNEVYQISLTEKKNIKYYDGYNFARLTLSPNLKYFSVLYDYHTYEKNNQLYIIDKNKHEKLLSIKDDIRIYRWSPDSKKIAYITGEYFEDQGLVSNGVWVYDIEKREKKKIAEKAKDIQWFSTDNIYIIDFFKEINKKKKRYDIITNSLVYNDGRGIIIKENIKGIQFSLDEKYSIVPNEHYHELESENIAVDIYDLNNEKNIPRDKISKIFNEPIEIRWDSLFWAHNNRLIYLQNLVGELGEIIYICDIENNKILQKIKARLIGTNNDRSKIVIYHNDEFKVVDVE